jgi:hypothetical protein
MPRSVNVVVEPGHLEIAPGATGQLRVRIVNRTPVVDQFVVVVLGVDERMAPQPQRIGLFPDQEGTVQLDLTVPAERPPFAGQRVVAVRVTSQDDPRLSRVEEFSLAIGPAAAASMRVQPPRIKGGSSGRFAVVLSNEGNVPMRLALRGEDEAEEVTFSFDPPLVELPPGATVQTRGRARAPRPFSGPETQRPLIVYAEGGPVPLAARATFAQRSAVGSRLLRAAALLGILAIALGIFLSTRHGSPQSSAKDGPVDTPSASTTPSASPTPTTGNGEGPVPDVAGKSAGEATGALAAQGFTVDKVEEHSNTVDSGAVIRTDPTPGKTAENKQVKLIVSNGPTPPFDMLEAAKDASWSNDNEGLPFNGSDQDTRGYVILRKNFPLEDGSTPPQVLETHPQGVPDGVVQGDYTLPTAIIEGDHFVSDVCFAQGRAGEVDFTVFVLDDQGNPQEVDQEKGTVHDTGADGQRQHLDVDLSKFAGRTKIRLRVDAGPSSAMDWAVWVNPRITGTPDAPSPAG